MDKNDIIVVTGLPRSGTSLMMQILQSLEIELFTDNHRSADDSNPKGYYEHELVKTLEDDNSWLTHAKGTAIKIVSPLIKYLPVNLNYRIILMNRDLDEIIQSQNKMLTERNVKEETIKSEALKQIFIKDLKQSREWIHTQLHCESLEISHSNLIDNPAPELKKIKSFLKIETDITLVLKVIDKKLYRSKPK